MKKKLWWFFLFFGPLTLFILAPAVYVFHVDPLWVYQHPFHMKGWHSGFDERQQKTNWLASRRPEIDTVLLGSSRTTYMDPQLFSPYGFNYGVSSGRPEEYVRFGLFASQCSKNRIKTWILETGFDTAIETASTFKVADVYVKRAEDFSYRLGLLFSRDAFKRAQLVISVKQEGEVPTGGIFYFSDRNGLAKSYRQEQPSNQDAFSEAVQRQLQIYAKDVFDVKWGYREGFQDIIKSCVTELSRDGATVVFYSPPTHWKMLLLMYRMGRFKEYRRWVYDVVQVTDGFWIFNYPNELTRRDENFKDSHHALPAALEQVAEQINSQGARGFEYGCYVTANNIEFFLSEVEKRLAELDNESGQSLF